MQDIDLTEKCEEKKKLINKNKYQDYFWSYKFTRNSSFKQKSGKLKIKKYIYKNLKVYIKMEKMFIRFGNIEIEKQKLHKHERPISIKYRYK